MMEESNTYLAGQCNIGPAEISARKRVGYFGLLLTLSYFIFALFGNISTWLAAMIFIPTMVSVTGFWQARKKFCLAFGFLGVFNFGKVGTSNSVMEKELKKIDRLQASKMFLQCALISAIVTIILTVLAKI
jgi:hypothetical protein